MPFIATWRYGPNQFLEADTWTKAIQEALVVGLEDPNRDELLVVMWKED